MESVEPWKILKTSRGLPRAALLPTYVSSNRLFLMNRFRLNSLAVALVAIWTITGCSAGQAPKGSGGVAEGAKTTAPADGQIFKGDGYSMTIPKSWTVIDLQAKDANQRLEALKKDKNFVSISDLASQLAQNKQMKLFAVMNNYSDKAFAANLNVIELPTGQDVPAETVFKENLKQLQGVSNNEPKQEFRKLGSAESSVILWDTEMMKKHMSYTTVIAWKKQTQYVFTFTTPYAFKDKAAQETDSVVGSIMFE